MDTESRYGWIITVDTLVESEQLLAKPTNLNAHGMIGPGRIGRDDERRLRDGKGLRFRMLDDDGTVYYEGRIVGQRATGFEPLDDFGTPNAGCTSIEFFALGRWSPL